jgi:PilZ domain-containing protein
MLIAFCSSRRENPANLKSQPENLADRRWGIRIEVDLPVRLELSRGRQVSGRMRNASVSGALIECPLELPVFTPLRVEILATPNRVPAPITLAARVVRAEHPHFGVEWRDFEPKSLLPLLQPG